MVALKTDKVIEKFDETCNSLELETKIYRIIASQYSQEEIKNMKIGLNNGTYKVKDLQIASSVTIPLTGSGMYVYAPDGSKYYFKDESIDLSYSFYGDKSDDLKMLEYVASSGNAVYNEDGAVWIKSDVDLRTIQ